MSSRQFPQAGPGTCSVLSVDVPLPGTAAHVRGWVCVEVPGAWGRDVLDGSALGSELAGALADRADAAGVRIMFVRRPGRGDREVRRRTVLLANSDPGHAWCERLEIGAVTDLLDIDFTLVAGPAPGLGERVDGPVVLVCAHGRRDRCCAVLGRPVAAALAAEFADVWECSHTGGHRFAPSTILLPTGITHGRLTPEESVRAVRAAATGGVYLPGLRGRSWWGARGQVAEVAVRRTIVADVNDLTVDEHAEDPVVTHRDGRRWQVRLEQATLPERPASCGADPKPVRPLVAVGVRELPAGMPAGSVTR